MCYFHGKHVRLQIQTCSGWLLCSCGQWVAGPLDSRHVRCCTVKEICFKENACLYFCRQVHGWNAGGTARVRTNHPERDDNQRNHLLTNLPRHVSGQHLLLLQNSGTSRSENQVHLSRLGRVWRRHTVSNFCPSVCVVVCVRVCCVSVYQAVNS